MDTSKLIDVLKRIEDKESGSGDVKFSDQHSNNSPPLDMRDVAFSVRRLISILESVDLDSVINKKAQENIIDDLAEKAEILLSNHLNYMTASPHTPSAVMSFLYAAEHQITSLITYDQMKGVLVLPHDLRKHVNSAKTALGKVREDMADISSKVDSINSAYKAAKELPLTMADLDQALVEIKAVKSSVDVMSGEVASALEKMNLAVGELGKKNEEANIVMGNLHDAYSAATSQSLAKSFSNKAHALNMSVRWWTLILLLSLAMAAFISYHRFPEVMHLMKERPDWSVIFANMFLGMAQMAAPVWFAVVATKQIAFRFRLAEDYDYKASLAAAYQGYKHEAKELDPLLGAQLFSIALNRLDEIPLRLIEKDMPGSPLMELIKSPEFKQAVDAVPSLGERLFAVLQRFGKTGNSVARQEHTEVTAPKSD